MEHISPVSSGSVYWESTVASLSEMHQGLMKNRAGQEVCNLSTVYFCKITSKICKEILKITEIMSQQYVH